MDIVMKKVDWDEYNGYKGIAIEVHYRVNYDMYEAKIFHNDSRYVELRENDYDTLKEKVIENIKKLKEKLEHKEEYYIVEEQ